MLTAEHVDEMNIAELCNGSTADSDSACEGSNPSSAATKESSFVYMTREDFFICLIFELRSLHIGEYIEFISIDSTVSFAYNKDTKLRSFNFSVR